MTQCEHNDVLNRYLDGELGPDQAAAVEEHLATCMDCRESAKRLRALSSQIRAIPSPQPQELMLEAVFARSQEQAEQPIRLHPRRPWLIAVAAMLAVALCITSVGVMARWVPQRQNRTDQELVDAVRMVASPRFRQMTDQERSPYVAIVREQANHIARAVQQGRLTLVERDRAMQVLVQDQVRRTVDGYYALQPGPERQRYLDRILDDQEEQARASHEPARPTPSPAALGALLESAPAAERTRLAQFIEELKRRQETRPLTPAMGPKR